MKAGHPHTVEVVVPGIRREVVVQIVFVSRAMPRVGAALGDDLHFGSGRAIEVGSLVGRISLELLHAICWSRHHASCPGSDASTLIRNSSRRISGKTGGIHAHAAVHIVGVVAAIQREITLVDCGACHTAVWTDTRL